MPKNPNAPNIKRRPDDRRGGRQGVQGNPQFKATEDQRRIVMAAKAAGIENVGLAAALGISSKTLSRHFKAELRHGGAMLEAKIAGKMASMALDTTHKDTQRAGEFLLRSKFGWRTRDELQHSFGVAKEEGALAEDQVQPAKVTIEFVSAKKTGLPGGPPAEE